MNLKMPCDWCGASTRGEYYMVHDHLFPSGVRFLCIGCLESMLGRKLNRLDFADVPVNWDRLDSFPKSDRFKDRLNADP